MKKQTKKGKDNTKVMIAVLAILVCAISVGFAALQSELNINGTITAKGNTWNVEFQNIANKAGVTPTSGPTISGTTISYEVKLDSPGDFFEFTVDVKNTGSLNAKLGTAPVITASDTCFIHTVKYTDGTSIAANDTLNSGASKNIKVRVEFNKDITSTQLTTCNSANESKIVTLNYVQA